MKKLTALTLSTAIIPVLALGTVAFADQDAGGMQADEKGMERAHDKQHDEQRTGTERDDELHAGDERDDELHAGDERHDELQTGTERADELHAGDERDDEQFMSRAPAGAVYTDGVIGKTVKHRQSGDNVGEIKDLVIGEDGSVLGVVITTGGFLGLGGQDVSLGWDRLDRVMEDERSVFYVDMDKETLRNAPEHERD